MCDSRYQRSAGCGCSLNYPLAWCPKYQGDVWVGQVAEAMRYRLYQKAAELDVKIKTLEIMLDHLSIESNPAEAPQCLANQFKGSTSRQLRQQSAHLHSRLPSLWSRSYSVGFVGQISVEAVRYSIEMQKSK